MSTTQRKAMVISCGNPSRSDDAVGHHVIDLLETMLQPSAPVVLLKMSQLDITLAERIATQDLVVFVDAALTRDASEKVSVQPLSGDPPPPSDLSSHTLTPTELLSVTGWVYGRVPKAVLVAIKGYDFSFGNQLSKPTRDAIPEAAKKTLELLNAFDRRLTN